MKISLNWLNDFIENTLSAPELEQVLTNCGLEVEHFEEYISVKGGLQGLVTGEVLTCVQHPNADRLRVTTVDAGTGTPLQIVCGAPNVAAGQKVAVALVGTTLYPTAGESFKISKSKIRGEVSEGMLCAEDEIGLGQSHAGIMVLPAETKVGLPLSQVLPVYTDTVFEIGLTPNRGDAASHLGVARDIFAVKNLPLKIWRKSLPAVKGDSKIEVSIEDSSACPRYSGCVVSGVKVQPSPAWLQNRLKAIGLSPINNIVDATNYVLHSIGQPIHAFDVSKIKGNKIIVKKAEAGTLFTTLDKTERKLHGFELMICNAVEPMAMAGVFGGLDSGINEATTEVFIESAYFNPATIRKAAKTHALSTDASFRFERGTDPDITIAAMELTAQLIMEVAGGEITSCTVDMYPAKTAPHQVPFNLTRFCKLAGKEIPATEIKSILQRLEIKISNDTGNADWVLTVPAYRVDVTREVDIAEEIMRIYGYNQIDIPASIRSCISVTPEEKFFRFRSRTGDFLSHSGFNEIYGFSLTSSANYSDEEKKSLVAILNPLSNELDVLRQTMLFYGLQTIQYNTNRKQADLKIYEFGKTYRKEANSYKEQNHLALWVTGKQNQPNWTTPATDVSYYYLKTFVGELLAKAGITNCESVHGHSAYLATRTQLMREGVLIGEYGMVSTALSKKYDIEAPVFYADLNWDIMCQTESASATVVTPVAKFPEVRRDLSLLIDKQVKFADLERIAHESERKLLRAVDMFDVYEGNKLPEGKKSYALSFILQDTEKTLTSEQVDKVMQKLVENYRKQLNAEIRQ
ncbi:MAG: phenylalanine--tRNA ligase subunit beta [Bacteroidia bacterium]|nr:phenylalanine--tRNA ligase subunit beta [Bacteroidia bacterium]